LIARGADGSLHGPRVGSGNGCNYSGRNRRCHAGRRNRSYRVRDLGGLSRRTHSRRRSNLRRKRGRNKRGGRSRDRCSESRIGLGHSSNRRHESLNIACRAERLRQLGHNCSGLLLGDLILFGVFLGLLASIGVGTRVLSQKRGGRK
jgi:hypothetical protein